MLTTSDEALKTPSLNRDITWNTSNMLFSGYEIVSEEYHFSRNPESWLVLPRALVSSVNVII